MIKMYIDNEEVVCDKEFTIKEEMLTTSSTILNNCYPKSWEQDHDYVSRFYYPKDYSKCLIYDEEYILPEEYTQVEYIESHHAEYIDTGYYCNPNTRIECDFQFTQVAQKQQRVFGSIYGEDNGLSASMYINGGGNFAWACQNGDGNWKATTLNADTNKHKFVMDMKNNKIYIDDYIENITTTHTNTSIYSLLLFAYRVKDTGAVHTQSKAYGKMYSARIYENDVLVHNFVPCYKNSNNELGMYDLITNAFFTNQGTGTFTYGQIQQDTSQELLFSGMVKNTGNINLNPRYPKYCSLEILDFKDFLSTGDLLDFVISEKTITEAITMVVDTVAQYGFILGNIQILNPNEVIGAYSTENKTAYDVLQYLADISQARWTTRLVDENTIAIDFYDPTLMPSGIDIEYNQSWWETNQVIDLTFNYGTRDYRNKQVMLSNEVYGGIDYTETILADGYNQTFMALSNIGTMQSIYVGGVSKTFATQEEKEIGVEADFYYTPGENIFSADSTASYSAGTQIVISYTPLVKGREVILNSTEISRINANTGRKGTISRYETRNDVLSSNELKTIGETYIKYKGSAEVILLLQTQVDIYNVGETVFFDAPIEELATDYMVKSKEIEYLANINKMFYTYELTSSFNSESAINWFDNQRNKTTGNISMGQSITRNIDIEEVANIIWDTLTITEVTPVGDNVLNSPLNSPFVE